MRLPCSLLTMRLQVDSSMSVWNCNVPLRMCGFVFFFNSGARHVRHRTHTFSVVRSTMLPSMFPLLFTAQALRWALYDLASDGEVVAFALYDLASDGDFVVCPCLCYLFGKAFTAARSEFSNLFGYAVVHCRLLESSILSWKADHSGAGSMSSALRI